MDSQLEYSLMSAGSEFLLVLVELEFLLVLP